MFQDEVQYLTSWGFFVLAGYGWWHDKPFWWVFILFGFLVYPPVSRKTPAKQEEVKSHVVKSEGAEVVKAGDEDRT